MSRSLFEIDDDDWNEYVDEMEDVSLVSDEEGSDEDQPNIFEEGGVIKIQNSKGEGIAISYDQYIEVMRKVGCPCPLCENELGFSVARNRREKKISVFRLWCEKCDRTFEVIRGDICVTDD